MQRKSIILLITVISFAVKSKSQTFDCYIANDTIISPSVYKFDVYVTPTTSDFYFRTIQLGLSFNPAFFPTGAVITGSVIPGTTELNSYSTGNPIWDSTHSCLSVPANSPPACTGEPNSTSNTLLMVNTPVRIASFQISSTIPFTCTNPDISMIRPKDPFPGVGILKMALSMWDNSCLAVSLGANGSYSHFSTNTLYGTVNNPLDTLCSVDILEITGMVSTFPNPTTGKLTVSSFNNIGKSIQLFASTGKLEFEMIQCRNPLITTLT